jgi:hypothetical protein
MHRVRLENVGEEAMDSHSNAQNFEAAFDAGADALADSIAGVHRRGVANPLRDPLVRAIIAADRVGTNEIGALFRDAAARLGLNCAHRRGPAPSIALGSA